MLLSPVFNGAQFFDDAGKPLAGGQLRSCIAGSFTTNATTYSTDAGTANENPINLDSSGRLPVSIWLDENSHYNFILLDALGTILKSVDGVSGSVDGTFLAGKFSDLDNVYLRLSGGTVTGGLAVTGSTQLHATNVTGNLVVSGTASAVGLDAGSGKVTNVAAPTANTDAVNKGYADNLAAVQAAVIPAQTGNAGKFLGTDGTALTWNAFNQGSTTYWSYNNAALSTPPSAATGVLNYTASTVVPKNCSYAAGVITVVSAGIYVVSGSATVGYQGTAGSADGHLLLYKNNASTGIAARWVEANNTVEASTITVGGVLSLAAGDTLSIVFKNDHDCHVYADLGFFYGFSIG